MKRLALIAVVLLAGCSSHPKGEVEKKQVPPPTRIPVGAVVVNPDTAGFPPVMLICEGTTLIAIMDTRTYRVVDGHGAKS